MRWLRLVVRVLLTVHLTGLALTLVLGCASAQFEVDWLFRLVVTPVFRITIGSGVLVAIVALVKQSVEPQKSTEYDRRSTDFSTDSFSPYRD